MEKVQVFSAHFPLHLQTFPVTLTHNTVQSIIQNMEEKHLLNKTTKLWGVWGNNTDYLK